MTVATRRRIGQGLLALAMAAMLTGAARGAEMLVSERMLPEDAIAAVVIRDGNATRERWKQTALYELLQTPEMKEMLAPLLESGRKAAQFQGPLPTPVEELAGLLEGEIALGATLVNTMDQPMPMV